MRSISARERLSAVSSASPPSAPFCASRYSLAAAAEALCVCCSRASGSSVVVLALDSALRRHGLGAVSDSRYVSKSRVSVRGREAEGR